LSQERAAQLIDAGIWLRLSGDLEGARKLFMRALKLDPANERAAQLLQEGAVAGAPDGAPAVGPAAGAAPGTPDGAAATSAGSVAAPVGGVASGAPLANSGASEVTAAPLADALTPGVGTPPGAVASAEVAPAGAPIASAPALVVGAEAQVATWAEVVVRAEVAPAPVGALSVESPPGAGGATAATDDWVVPLSAAPPPEAWGSPAPPERSTGEVLPGASSAQPQPRPIVDGPSTPEQAPAQAAASTSVEAALGGAVASGPSLAAEARPPTQPASAVPSSVAAGGPSPSGDTVASAADDEDSAVYMLSDEVTDEPEAAPPVAAAAGGAALVEDVDWGRAAGPEPRAVGAPPTPVADDWGSMLGAPLPGPAGAPAAFTGTISLGEAPPAARSTPPIYASAAEAPAPVSPTVVLDGAAPPPSPVRATPPQFFEPPLAARPNPAPVAVAPQVGVGWQPPAFEPVPSSTIVLTGANAPQPSPPRSTPPLYEPGLSSQPATTVVLTGANAPQPAPVRSTPPLYEPGPASASPSAPAPSPHAPRRSAAESPEAGGVAWSWSTNTPAPFRAPAAPVPEVRPPALAFDATSAWDNRSNPGIQLPALANEAKALDMLSSDTPAKRAAGGETAKDEVGALLRGARDLLDLDDHTGAMELILKAQRLSPDDADVKAMRERSEKTLLTMFESKIGKIETVPRVLLKEDEVIWLNLDHRAGFVLAQIDGTVSFDDVFAVSGMSRLDTARILAQLIDEGVISRG
jgi:hypothetical protein